MSNLIRIFIVLSIISCKDSKQKNLTNRFIIEQDGNVDIVEAKHTSRQEQGYLFIDISKIYHYGGQFLITDELGNALILFKDKNVTIGQNTYDILKEEQKYSQSIVVESYFPEYGLFIMKATKVEEGVYEAYYNGEKVIINESGNHLKFKITENYILESYPNPSETNPLRSAPDDNSEIVKGFENHTYVSLEIMGDWLKIIDDKDCYLGERPLESDIIGWVRWKKEGKLILDIRHIC